MRCDNLFVMKGTRCGLTAHWASRTGVIRGGGYMTRPIFMAKANVTSKLAFGRTQDVGTLRSVSILRATVAHWTCRGVSKMVKGRAHMVVIRFFVI
jgi:hypothetical protein